MVRKNYFEILDGMNFNPSTEFDTLCILLSNGLLEELNHKFLNYQNRRTFIDFDEFLKFCLSQADNELEKLFIFAELLNDMLSIINPNHPFLRNDVYAVRENINRVLDLSNHEFLTLENGDKIIVEKNVYASEVSQIVSETSIQDAIKVLEYNHFSNKGNIQRKKEILIASANYLEPFRRELNNSEELKDILKVNNQKVIAFEKLFEMYNNFGLRHNNSNQYHLDLADDELEQWYDDIYTSTLFVILSMDESRILSKLKTLREE
jgi:conserved domain protein